MARCTSSSDPRDHSFQNPHRTNSGRSRESRPDGVVGAGSGTTPAGAASPQNAERSKRCVFFFFFFFFFLQPTTPAGARGTDGATTGVISNSTRHHIPFQIMGNKPCPALLCPAPLFQVQMTDRAMVPTDQLCKGGCQNASVFPPRMSSPASLNSSLPLPDTEF